MFRAAFLSCIIPGAFALPIRLASMPPPVPERVHARLRVNGPDFMLVMARVGNPALRSAPGASPEALLPRVGRTSTLLRGGAAI